MVTDDSISESVLNIENVEILETKPSKFFTCAHCSKIFTTKKGISPHIRRVHAEVLRIKTSNENKVRKSDIQCPMCKTGFTRLFVLYEHLRKDHDVQLVNESKKFSNVREFESWKSEIEKSESCMYVKRNSCKHKSGDRRVFWRCHRTGSFNGKLLRKRQLKSQGSNKIEATCPSTMTVTVKVSQEVEVDYCKTHIGHSNNISRRSLTREDRAAIAGKIFDGVSFERILDEIRENIKDLSDPRASISRKDLHNIKRDFNPNRTTHSAEKLEQMLSMPETCVLEEEIYEDEEFKEEEDDKKHSIINHKLQMLRSYVSEFTEEEFSRCNHILDNLLLEFSKLKRKPPQENTESSSKIVKSEERLLMKSKSPPKIPDQSPASPQITMSNIESELTETVNIIIELNDEHSPIN